MVNRNATNETTFTILPHVLQNQSLLGSACPLSPHSPPKVQKSGEFDWDEVQQGIILGSFFYGYMLTQLPGGLLAQRFGGKWPLGLGLLVTAIFALLTPLAARTHIGLLIACRVVQGLGEVWNFLKLYFVLQNL